MTDLKQRLQIGSFGALLGCAGVPIYIHLPRFASAELGIGLSIVALILIGIRLMDFAQDPLLGRLIDRLPNQRNTLVLLAIFGLAIGFLMVFSVPFETIPGLWLTMGLIVLLTSYSLGTLLLYGVGAEQNRDALWAISTFREIGIITGILIGSIAPQFFSYISQNSNGYTQYGIFIAVLCVPSFFWSKVNRTPPGVLANSARIRVRLDRPMVRMLTLAVVNSLPVAITSTLFLFFVEDRLQQPDQSGLFLLAFFLSAGVFVPVWSRVSKKIGAKNTLTIAMIIAIVSFGFAAMLTLQTANAFWIVCLVSGAAVGADMVILPVLFTTTLAAAKQPVGQAFGLWFMASKLSLACAAILVLPLLDVAGFNPGGTNSDSAIALLVTLYALVPCLLKIASIAMVRSLPKEIYSI